MPTLCGVAHKSGRMTPRLGSRGYELVQSHLNMPIETTQ